MPTSSSSSEVAAAARPPRASAAFGGAGRIGIGLGIAVVTALVFAPALGGEFVFDDPYILFGKADYRGFGARQLRWMFTSAHLGHYHPLTWLSFAVDHRLYGDTPWGYHLTNLLLHALNAVLVYALLLELLRRSTAAPPQASDRTVAAALGALLFALHPLRVESVAWVTERRGLLAGLFSLVTVGAYLRMHDAGRVRGRWGAVSFGAFVLAVLAKASSMTVPVVLVVLDAYPLRRAAARPWPQLVAEKVPYFVLAAATAVWAAAAQRAGGAMWSLAEHGVAGRLVQSAYGVGFYTWKMLVPMALSPLHALQSHDPWAPGALALAAGAVLVTLALCALRARWPAGAAAWLSYLVMLAPTLGLAQSGMQVVAERYTYVAVVPLVALLAGGLQATLARGHRLAVVLAACGVLAALAAASRAQIAVWHDLRSLWERVVAVDPRSADGWQNLGIVRLSAGDTPGALADLDRAVAVAPDYAPAFHARGTVRDILHDVAGARADYDRAIALLPAWPNPYNYRGNLRLAQGDVAGALSDYDQVLALVPDHTEARYNRAVARERNHDAAGALADMDALLAVAPTYASAYAMRARYRAALGNLSGALADCERALELLPPGSPDARTVEGYRAEVRARMEAAGR